MAKISEAYEDFWKTVYKYFKCDRTLLDKFYEGYDFSKTMTVLNKTIWYEVQPEKPIQAVLGYLNSVSAYQCYLEENKIEKGSENDPMRIFKEVVDEVNSDITIDFVTPYYVILLGKKE